PLVLLKPFTFMLAILQVTSDLFVQFSNLIW
uniref:Uncharacterized protein n=1 Tax=Aegilops tauschii subsp. strangulata TaxID=200361 RepID=A0A453RTG2_AEGTS